MIQENPYGVEFSTSQPPTQTMKHSGVGIASFVLSLFSGMALFALFAIAGYLESQSSTGMKEDAPATILLGLVLMAAGMAQFLALILGVVGLFQSNRRKLYPLLGTILSLMSILLFGGLMVVGLVLQANGY